MDISKIVLGTGQFGSLSEKKNAFEVMERYLALSGCTFDTARVYGEDGASEKIVGEFVRTHGVRKDVIIVTKGAHHSISDEYRTPRLSESDIKSDLNKSLDALKLDCVDIYLLHRDDPHRDVGEIAETMHGLVKSGLVKSIGVSNWKYDRIKSLNEYAKEHALTPFTYNQVEFGRAVINLDYRPDPTLVSLNEAEYEKFAQDDLGVRLMAYSAQSNGFFYKAAKSGVENLPEWLKAKFLNAGTLENLRLISSVAKEIEATAATAALASVICDKLNIAAVVGARTAPQIEEAMAALSLSTAVMRELSEKLKK